MAFKHRKLFFDPNLLNITAFCEPYCDPIGNDNRICPPLICKKTCPHTCTNPFPSLIPPLKPPPPPTTTSDYHHHQKKFLQNPHLYLIISLSVLAVFCFVFSTYSLCKYYRNRNRASPPQDETDDTHEQFFDEEHGPVLDHPIWYIRTIGLQQSAINAITICKYKRGDGLVEGTECSVCLNEFQEDETLRLLPKCNHAFHLPCIDTWLRSHTNCPMCRAGIVLTGLAGLAGRPEPVQEEEVREESSDEEEEIEEERAFEGEAEETTVVGVGEVLQPMRRSVSLDCVSASMISNAIANSNSGDSSDTQLAKSKNSSSIESSLAVLKMKRSVSCSGNVLMKKSNSRNQI